MNNEDMSDIIQKLNDMMNSNKQVSDNNDDISSNSNETSFNNLQDIISNINLNQQDNNNNDDTNNFNIDFETIMKIKTIIDNLNSSKSSPETNLLLSLKPYLNNNRKQKLNQYIQFFNIYKIIEALNSNGGVYNK